MPKKRKVHPKVVENGRAAVLSPVPETELEFIATMPGDRQQSSHEVVFDFDMFETRCDCVDFIGDPGNPKLCRHIRELVETRVIREGHRWNVGGIVEAVRREKPVAPSVPQHSSRPPLLRVFEALRKSGVACAWAVGKASSTADVEVSSMRAWLSVRPHEAALVGFKCDQSRETGVMLRLLAKQDLSQIMPRVSQALHAEGLHRFDVHNEADAIRIVIHEEDAKP